MLARKSTGTKKAAAAALLLVSYRTLDKKRSPQASADAFAAPRRPQGPLRTRRAAPLHQSEQFGSLPIAQPRTAARSTIQLLR